MKSQKQKSLSIEKAVNEISKKKKRTLTDALIHDVCKKHGVIETNVRAIMGWEYC